jgi:cation diffusion facilitator family transporter
MADAWHHRSDALSSIGSAVGTIGVMLGFPIMDSVASIVICVFIILAGVNIMREAIDKLVDKSCDDSTIESIERVIMAQSGVRGVDELKTRLFGSKVYIDVTILIDEDTILKEAHQIAENVHDSVEESFDNVKHCMVHIHPYTTL